MAKLKIELDTDDYKTENELYESIIKGLQEAIEMNNAVNEKKNCRPKFHEQYWYIISSGNVQTDIWNGESPDESRLSTRNAFITREEAEFEAERRKVIAELETFAEENNDDIDWNNRDQVKHAIIYDHEKNEIKMAHNFAMQYNNLYFSSEELIYQAIEKIGKDRIKKYLFGVED